MYQINCGKIFSLIGLTSLLTFSPIISGSLLAEEVKDGFPGRRFGGSTRSSCAVDGNNLAVLIPENNLWVTAAAYPQFYFYVPQANGSQAVEFVLRDEQDQQVYEKTFTMTAKSGIVSLGLPEDESMLPLESNKNYRWYLSLICNAQNRSQDIVVEGWIQRVEVANQLSNTLDEADLKTRAKLYLEAGIWHEALSILAQLRRDYPEDDVVTDNWEKLLQSVGLDAIAQEPLVDIASF